MLLAAFRSDDTPFERTFQSPPRSLLILDGAEVRHASHPVRLELQRYRDRDSAGVEAFNTAVLDAISVLRRWRPGEVQLSGGKDSRYVAAALRRAEISATVVTHSAETSREGCAAAAVARALKIDHHFVPGPGVAVAERLLPTVLGNLRLSDGLLGENRQLANIPLEHAGQPLIQGQAHHPRGGFPVRAHKDRDKMAATLVARNLGSPNFVAAEMVDERRRRLEGLLDAYRVPFVPDLSYWLYGDWRMARWLNAAYRATSRFRPVLWPMADERVLRVVSELSSFDRLGEVAFYSALQRLSQDVAAVPLFEDTWKFDDGPIGATEFPDGLEARRQPFVEQGGALSAERRLFTARPLFLLATRELRFSDELRSLIQPHVLDAMSSSHDPARVLGCRHIEVIDFMWRAAAVALVMQGDWARASVAASPQESQHRQIRVRAAGLSRRSLRPMSSTRRNTFLSTVASTGREAVSGLSGRLPKRSRKLVRGVARTARRLMNGRSGSGNGVYGVQGYPDAFRVRPRPAPIPEDWPDPPVVADPNDRVRYFPTFIRHEPYRFDIDLFERLNAEYETKPVYPTPPKYDTPTIATRTRKSLMQVHRAIDLAQKRVLEIGCGTGYNVWFLAHHFGSEAYGVDVAERVTWKAIADDRTHFVWADITDNSPFAADFFDRVMSFAVWEHVTHPYRALEEVHRILKPGGLVWMNANLYRGPMASHLYREIKFPWPHLLFSDEVIKEFYKRQGLRERGAAWVNKLTWAQYERYFEQLGFKVKMVKFVGRPFDKEFYERFENALNRYPRFDLDKDFFTAVLEKPKPRTSSWRSRLGRKG